MILSIYFFTYVVWIICLSVDASRQHELGAPLRRAHYFEGKHDGDSEYIRGSLGSRHSVSLNIVCKMHVRHTMLWQRIKVHRRQIIICMGGICMSSSTIDPSLWHPRRRSLRRIRWCSSGRSSWMYNLLQNVQ